MAKKGNDSKRKHKLARSRTGTKKLWRHSLTTAERQAKRFGTALKEHQQHVAPDLKTDWHTQLDTAAKELVPEVNVRRTVGLERMQRERHKSLELQQRCLKALQAEAFALGAKTEDYTAEDKLRLDQLEVLLPAAKQGLAALRRS